MRLAAKKWLISVALAGAAVLAIAVLGSDPRQQLPHESDLEPLPVKEMFARGIYQHLVETSFDVKSVDVRRGQSVTVPFAIEHHSHVWWEPVTLKNFQNRLPNYFPAYEEISVDSYLIYSPGSVVLQSNSSARGYVRISLPATLPDGMLNQTAKITASFDASYVLADKGSTARAPGILLIRIVG